MTPDSRYRCGRILSIDPPRLTTAKNGPPPSVSCQEADSIFSRWRSKYACSRVSSFALHRLTGVRPIGIPSGFGRPSSGTCGGPLLATCPNCGSDLAGVDGERCPSCSLPLKVACPNCGEHAWADEEECPACETPLSFAVDA